MKVISGFLKGRNITGFNILGTRPTMDRVKESLFAIIQNNIEDKYILDLFSGSGNLGIEAISNGARYCYFNDVNKECIKVIKENIIKFNITDKASLINKSWEDCLEFLKDKQQFSLVFLDPPYKMLCLNEVIDKIISNNLLTKEGLIICEVSHNYLKSFNTLEVIKEKKYGDKMIIILKKVS